MSRSLRLHPVRSERLDVLGVLGVYLCDVLGCSTVGFVYSSAVTDSDMLHTLSRGEVVGTLEAVAISMMCMATPVQVRLTDSLVIQLATLGGRRQKLRRRPLKLNSLDDRALFPLKENKYAATKVNVFFRDVWSDIRTYFPHQATQIQQLSGGLAGKHNDQASAICMYVTLASAGTGLPVSVFWLAASCVSFGKQLTTVLKACGAGQNRLATLLLETNTLVGRGVGEVSLHDEAKYRCDSAAVAQKVVNLDREDLRRAVRNVLDREVNFSKLTVERTDKEDHFSRRWLTTVNGAHSSRVHGKYGIPPVPPRLRKMQLHRRVGAEIMDSDPTLQWDGEVEVSVSGKLEHGKTRALFACDTVSYMAFDWLLRPVEEAWRGKRVILDPGSGGHLGVCRRVSEKLRARQCAVMLDYDDFNSQHSLDAQRLVIEEASKHLAGHYVREKCLASFDRMRVQCEGADYGYALGTLMSGHRATTFINSVLNEAYLCAIFGDGWRSVDSLHVGDDVIIFCDGMAEAEHIMSCARASPLRFNAVKQSYGIYATEFLRIAGGNGVFRGYLARAVASTVAGNWTNDVMLGELEAVSTYGQMAWTLVNRSGSDRAGLLLYSTMCRRVSLLKRTLIRGILLGCVSVNGGPVRSGLTLYRSITTKSRRIFHEEGGKLAGLPAAATMAYLDRHVTPIEARAVRLAKADAKRLMLEASYNKSLVASGSSSLEVRVSRDVKVPVVGHASLDAVLRAGRRSSELDKYPLVGLVKSGLSRQDVVALLRAAGIVPSKYELDCFFGVSHDAVTSTGKGVSYSDAQAGAAASPGQLLVTSIPIYM